MTERSATELAAGIRARDYSAREVMEAHLARIAAVNPRINAIVTFVEPERALRDADRADRAVADGEPLGPLHGLPIAIKDLSDTAGLRTTYGSPIYRDHVPDADSMLVERIRRAGAIVIGKTNTPEWGAGSHTFNAVFGATRNPYDLERTPGGSSGGAAAAVAAGLIPLADGSDFGGSIRNPAAMCNLVGLRPTPGRIPVLDEDDAFDTLAVHGPIARTVADAALFLDAVSGPDDRCPVSLHDAPGRFADAAIAGEVRGVRVAWSRNLGDLPVEAEVTAVLEQRRATLEELGCIVEEAEPRLAGADEAFEVLRAVGFAEFFGPLLEEGAPLKDTVVWNTRAGLELSGVQVVHASTLRSRAFHAMRELLTRFDVLALPVTQVVAFPVEVEWPRSVAGVPMRSYLEWMRSCSRITVTAHPAIAVPAGFTPAGLPVGLQLVGRHRDERGLLRLAAALEAATGCADSRPRL